MLLGHMFFLRFPPLSKKKMAEKYTRKILYLHEQLGAEFDIESFVDAIEPEKIGLSDKSQFYEPLRFSVQICGGINAAAGAITLAVPVHANPQWLSTMKRRFAHMVGVEARVETMDFRMINGQSISTVKDADELTRIGKLNFSLTMSWCDCLPCPSFPLSTA